MGFLCHVLQGQIIIRDVEHLNDLKKLPLEKMYVHHDASLLFPGEYLLYSVYCINAYSYTLSEISKIAYVELVSEKGKIIFSHKLRLDKGRGQGDFFVPVDLPSGNYKLIGYTQWMKNGGVGQVFKDDVVVINPYQADQSALLTSDKKADSLDTVNKITPNSIAPGTVSASGEEIIQLLIDSTQYGLRSKISLLPKNYKGPLGYGSYSIEIRKKDALLNARGVTALAFSMDTNVNRFITQHVNDSLYLPEQLGELFWGNVIVSDTGAPAVAKTVVISLPGADFQLKYAITDQNGNFFTYLNKEYDASSAIVQLLDDDKKAFDIGIKKTAPLDYGALKFKKFRMIPEIKKKIVARSVENQIENAFFMVKPDTIVSVKDNDPFIGGNPEVYTLDDYTRFPTLQETLVEVVDNVWVRRVDGQESIRVRQYFEPTKEQYINLPPLVFIDGVLIPNHKEILEFNAYDIKTIKTVRDQFVIGGKEYLGMVVIETVAGNYYDQWQDNTHGIKQVLDAPRPPKNYFKPDYAGENKAKKRRIPDFRRELLWVPDFKIDGKEQGLECYTSDIPGDYEIILEGFTSYGKPISITKDFKVVD
jgi:hypothetical protein